jgi:two-component system response regulator NreC
MAIRLVLADDHEIVRDGMKAVLEREGFEVIGEASDGHSAVRTVSATRPDVAVIDVAMPLLNGIDASREIGALCPATRVIVLTIHTDAPYVLEAFRAGVRGYVLKTQATHDLCRAIYEAAAGRMYLSPGISGTIISQCLSSQKAEEASLTRRERQVLQLVAESKTTKQIATILGVSSKTAESHRVRLMSKLNIHDTAGLVRYAIRRGLVQP